MTGTERKRAWRLRNPERSRTAERERAQARRHGFWGKRDLGVTSRPCTSQDSYYKYELSTRRMLERINWPTVGAGSAKMTREELSAARRAYFMERARELGVEFDGPMSPVDISNKLFAICVEESKQA
jgi:hypothetical protein